MIKKYEAYSLVEMLITLVLIGVVLITVAVVLASLLRTSIMTEARALARSENEFIMEVIDRNISNSQADSILVYEQSGRSLGSNGEIIQEGTYSFSEVGIGSGGVGNEIHVLPVNAQRWICIAHMIEIRDGEEFGFIVKTSAPIDLIQPTDLSVSSHSGCFDPNTNPDLYSYLTYFNSNDIKVISADDGSVGFGISTYMGADGNTYAQIDLNTTPIHWVGGEQAFLQPDYSRTMFVRTRLLNF